jgi:hypothetical protein
MTEAKGQGPHANEPSLLTNEIMPTSTLMRAGIGTLLAAIAARGEGASRLHRILHRDYP